MSTHTPVTEDHVVTCDDAGHRTGTIPRAEVHTTDTPLHLAFSCYLLDDAGNLLVTRRALVKRTWPGVWTNSFCGHLRWTETAEDSLQRHVVHELGAQVTDVQVALPDFRYRAVDASGVVENEICPVYVARVVGDVAPNPDEVAEHVWTPAPSFRTAVEATPWAFSPWMVEQVDALAAIPPADRTPGAVVLAAALGLR
ncbi:isopentenyl-diphosphate delta-isomerase [Isoptericola jiangsuensis]|uniref:Isopentenyl-diphosphate Delta-isomerase n=1 Tax=Isoptericola jiangsuensis TaxID=548579 RepID=A0A2A9EU19_9MICO|nr:isopentenyl-diphosphate Delta-isomerase [Isoptericola jiangsuensis]PFG41669.1 isopentenyl-diphosphate delta-isomerase [Isoptericola jiangsuensis]